jgi:hypothetical protein
MGWILKNTNPFGESRYRLEYKEQTGQWHHERHGSGREPNTHGWATVMDDVTDYEITAFDIFIEHASGRKGKWTLAEVREYQKRFEAFIKEMNRMHITDITHEEA